MTYKRKLFYFISFIFIVLVFLLFIQFKSYESYNQGIASVNETKLVTKDIEYLDEVLTMSTRMAAYTGDNQWKERYDKHVSILDEKLAFISQDTEVRDLIKLTDIANTKLVNLEELAFSLVSQGKSKKAQNILSSDEYLLHKQEYTQGLQRTFDFISKKTEDISKEHNKDFISILIISAILIVLIIVSGVCISLTLRKEEKQKLEELNKFNDKLTVEVQKQTKKLNEVIEKFTFASDNALSGFWEIDLETNNVSFSDGWFQYLGYSQKDFTNVTSEEVLERIIYIDDLNRVKDEVENYLTGKDNRYNTEFRVLHKDGTYTWINAVGAVYQNKFFGFHIDINNLKQANTIITEQSKMVAMGEMIGNIAHQWRQPLNMISTKATGALFQKEIGTLSDEQLNESLENINDTAQYLSKTIDTFRNFIKSSSDKQVVTTTIQDEINAAISLVNASYHSNYIKIYSEIVDDPIQVVLAEGELTQVIINILNNAKDILKEHNSDDNRWVKVILEKDNEKSIISIEDNAGGIPADIIGRVFEPYFSTKHQTQGTGLGLHMSYQIINESIGGKLFVENTKNGAKFFIEIPFN